MKNKKIVIFGCQSISIQILRYLNDLEWVDIVKVITYEVPSDISRGQESLIDAAQEMDIKVSSPSRLSSEVISEIRKLNPDLIISAYYRKIFNKEIIAIPKLGVVNIHPSILPYYRGPVPTAWAILNGEKEFGVTVHKVDEGIDTGDILIQKKFKIMDDETGHELYLRAMNLGAKLFIENFNEIIEDKIKPKMQQPGGSYFGKLKTKVLVNWKDSAESIRNQVRVRAYPYNPIETILENKYFFINRVSIIKEVKMHVQVPGKILKIYDDDRLLVSCSDGAIIIEDYDVYPKFTELEKDIYLKIGRMFDYQG
tara:strand:- start:792 stop:1724 length:933 start_codon:yes stop_codon:yes gene_type:complete